MRKFLALDEATRNEAFRETAARMNLHPVPVEKDFWVCVVLGALFSLECTRDRLLFKGGTSLSKAYGVIDRFSEDIDLSIDATAFGGSSVISDSGMTEDQRRSEVQKLFEQARRFIQTTFVSELRGRLGEIMARDEPRLDLRSRREDFHILEFNYPRVPQDSSKSHYTKPQIQIDLSVRAEHEPAEHLPIHPYVAETFPRLFDKPETMVKVLSAKRTFWEKVTIFHAESFKTVDQKMPRRLARHAYDLHQLMQRDLGKDELRDFDLLKRVVHHKASFHPIEGVDYLQATRGNLKVVLESYRLEQLEDDYAAMKDFFMTKPPPFEDVLESLQFIEDQTNHHHRPQ